jgi:pimeloyl-ACP methyl ester carboxylesterase
MPDPLVLIPGLLCTRALWEPQIAALQDQVRIQVADHTRQDSMAGLASDILAQAPNRFALAGLSMGGYIALEIMRQAPSRVTRLALMDTNARADTPEGRKNRQGFIDIARRGKFLGVTPQLIPKLIHPSRLDDHDLKLTIVQMARETGVDAFVRQETAIMNRIDSRGSLGAITCPTLVLCGRQDMLSTLEMHQEMVDLIPNACLEVVEDCGHLSTLERPEVVTAAMKAWLQA